MQNYTSVVPTPLLKLTYTVTGHLRCQKKNKINNIRVVSLHQKDQLNINEKKIFKVKNLRTRCFKTILQFYFFVQQNVFNI